MKRLHLTVLLLFVLSHQAYAGESPGKGEADFVTWQINPSFSYSGYEVHIDDENYMMHKLDVNLSLETEYWNKQGVAEARLDSGYAYEIGLGSATGQPHSGRVGIEGRFIEGYTQMFDTGEWGLTELLLKGQRTIGVAGDLTYDFDRKQGHFLTAGVGAGFAVIWFRNSGRKSTQKEGSFAVYLLGGYRYLKYESDKYSENESANLNFIAGSDISNGGISRMFAHPNYAEPCFLGRVQGDYRLKNGISLSGSLAFSVNHIKTVSLSGQISFPLGQVQGLNFTLGYDLEFQKQSSSVGINVVENNFRSDVSLEKFHHNASTGLTYSF